MKFEIPYGKTTVSVEIDEKRVLGVLTPNELSVERNGLEALDWSLDHPIASERLEDLCVPGERVVIVTSDITRPVPSAVILPRLLERLSRAGIPDRDITLVFALGSIANIRLLR